MKICIADQMRKEHLKVYTIIQSDLHRMLEWGGWGGVLQIDIGKRCYLVDGYFQMENNEQRDKRIKSLT